MSINLEQNDIKKTLTDKLNRYFGLSPEDANSEQMYKAVVHSIRDILALRYNLFQAQAKRQESKRVYYLCLEFLVGRSMRNNLMNLNIESTYRRALKELGFELNDLYEYEADPGLGNGGLGRLAACYMDALSSQSYPVRGFSICYEYGLFKQRIEDGKQVELPDIWLPSGESWLVPRQDKSVTVCFGGRVNEKWSENGSHEISYEDYDEIEAVPYDMFIPGANGDAVNTLRLWKANDKHNFDMDLFSQGYYMKAVEENTMAETLSKVLYPADNHHEGMLLRLSQEYFLVSASVQNIVKSHLRHNKTLTTLSDKVAIHINDTHPALVIPELMRILMDDYNFSWENAWEITVNTVSYTNHTVLPEALECWNEELFKVKLPRIYMILKEINERFCREAWKVYPGNWDKVGRMAIIDRGLVRMANLSIVGSHCINGVSKLHSDILVNTVFKDYYGMYPERFTNVTNGITHRRWLINANPGLCNLLDNTIGTGYRKNPAELEKLMAFKEDKSVLYALEKVKRDNKVAFSEFMYKTKGVRIDPDSIFDVQAKRLHEYKRQLMNALNIINLYIKLKENPTMVMRPRTFLFAAKAAPGYYLAKDIIRLICYIGADIEKDPSVREKMRVVFLENYNVSLAERLMPAAEVSKQISLAGKEASGTGNMKFMINGAITIGTLDGANVEMAEKVGKDNIFIFGHTAEDVTELWRKGYASSDYYNRNESLKRAVDSLQVGYNGRSFSDIAKYLLYSIGVSDPFMCLADFDSYNEACKKLTAKYENRMEWNAMALVNIAKAGYFAADRSVKEYADNIWHIKPVEKE